MGSQLNPSGDKVPPDAMYEACRVMAKYVTWNGGMDWDFRKLLEGRIDPAFEVHINSYLEDVLRKDAVHKGWKIPETTLVYPWVARMFPDAKFIQWIRDPRDCILGKHMTDNLAQFEIEHPPTPDLYKRRAISWLYQYKIINATPTPKQVIRVRFEDFVLNQETTLNRLESFLGIPLSRIVVRPESVGRWKELESTICCLYDLLEGPLTENHYPLSVAGTEPQESHDQSAEHPLPHE